jgi:ubiquinone biosynthesis protein COQ4
MKRPRALRNRRRLGPLALLRSYQELRKARATGDPKIVLQFMRPFHTPQFERTFARVLADPVGSRLLGEGRSLLPVLSDLRSLWALPEGSLGREYARFMEAEELSVTDFAEASSASMNESDYDDRRAWILAQRLRDMHDLIHVVSGYGRDLLGEMAVLSFSSGARKARENYRLFFILRLARWQFGRSGRPDAAGVLRAAEERGARAAFLPAVEWERLLPMPLSVVRERLGISPPPCVRTDPLRPLVYSGEPQSAAQQDAAAAAARRGAIDPRCRLAANDVG